MQVPSLGRGIITELCIQRTHQAVPWISCKADYDWLNPYHLEIISASGYFDYLA